VCLQIVEGFSGYLILSCDEFDLQAASLRAPSFSMKVAEKQQVHANHCLKDGTPLQ